MLWLMIASTLFINAKMIIRNPTSMEGIRYCGRYVYEGEVKSADQ
jgi:hypothetical protein